MSAHVAGPPEPPDGGKEYWVVRPARPQIDQRPGVLEAELSRYQVGTRRERWEAEDTHQAELARRRREEMDAEFARRMIEKLIEARIIDHQRRRESELVDQQVKAISDRETVETRNRDLERASRTATVEQVVYLCVVAIGVIAAVVLAFLTEGQPLQYRFSPLAGLLICGAGVKLGRISREPRFLRPGEGRESGDEPGIGSGQP